MLSGLTPLKNLEEEVTMLALLNKNLSKFYFFVFFIFSIVLIYLEVLQAMKLKKLLLNQPPTEIVMPHLAIPLSLLKSSTKDKVLKLLWMIMNQLKKLNK
jgi:hypothetical protein